VSVVRRVDHTTVLDQVVEIAEHVISDWDLDLPEPIGPSTRLVADLDFDSIDLVCLFVAIEGRHAETPLRFEELVTVDGEYVEDLTLDQVAAFVRKRLDEK
jgi:acyl carrier protein